MGGVHREWKDEKWTAAMKLESIKIFGKDRFLVIRPMWFHSRDHQLTSKSMKREPDRSCDHEGPWNKYISKSTQYSKHIWHPICSWTNTNTHYFSWQADQCLSYFFWNLIWIQNSWSRSKPRVNQFIVGSQPHDTTDYIQIQAGVMLVTIQTS